MINRSKADGARIANQILHGVAPHPGACQCVLCALPRGGAWGELELYRRIMRMGEEIHRGMRGLGDWILIGSGVKRLPVPAGSFQEPAVKTTREPGSAVRELERRAREKKGPSEQLTLNDVLRGDVVSDSITDDFDRILDEIAFGRDPVQGGWYRQRSESGSARRAEECLRDVQSNIDSTYGKMARSSAYGKAQRTRRAVLPLSTTVGKSDVGTIFWFVAMPDRPFKGKYLIVTTYQGLDILFLHAGDKIVLGGPIDAALYSPPNWDEMARLEQLERVAIDMNAVSPGCQVKMQVRVRELSGRRLTPFEFRAVLLGEEVVD